MSRLRERSNSRIVKTTINYVFLNGSRMTTRIRYEAILAAGQRPETEQKDPIL